MVKISPSQEKFITQLKAAKLTYDKGVAAIDAEAKLRKQALRGPVMGVVKAALDAGIPARQVAVRGLGYSDVSGLRTFMTAQPVALGATDSVVFAPKRETGEFEAQVFEHINSLGNANPLRLDLIDTFGNPAGDVILSLNRGGERVFVSHIEGEHSDLRQLNNAVEDFLNDAYPDRLIEWE